MFADVGDAMRVSRDEIFGPVQCISKWSSMDEVGGLGVRAARVIVCVGGQARGGAAQNATSSRLNTHTHTHTHTTNTHTQVIRRANDTVYGLAAGVFSTNIDSINTLTRGIRSGTVWCAARVCMCVRERVRESQTLKADSARSHARTHAHTFARLPG